MSRQKRFPTNAFTLRRRRATTFTLDSQRPPDPDTRFPVLSTHHPRILLTNFHPNGGGGHVTFIRSILQSPLALHYQFGVASPPGSLALKTAQDLGIPAFPCWFPGSLREIPDVLRAVSAFGAICGDFRPDLIHCNGGRDHSIVLYRRWWDNGDEPVVRTHHAIRQLPNTPYHQWLLTRATALNTFVCHSAHSLSTAGKALKVQNYAVVENGVDLAHFAPISPDQDLQRQLGLEPGVRVFGSCAGLGSYKRVDLLMRAASRLREKYPFRILALGGEAAGREYIALAKSLGLEDRFIYGGFQTDVRPWCSLFDVGFILSDRIETISFAAREMLAMGIPLISSTYAGLVENVEDGYNGWRVRPGSVDDVEEAMVRMLELNPEELRVMGANARAKAQRSFGIDRQTEGMDQVYTQVLRKRAP